MLTKQTLSWAEIKRTDWWKHYRKQNTWTFTTVLPALLLVHQTLTAWCWPDAVTRFIPGCAGQVPAKISWQGPQIKTCLPFAHFHLEPTVQPSIPYASSPLLPLILSFLLPLSHAGESGMQGQTWGSKKRKKTGGERHWGVGMARKKRGEEKKRNAHCTFQMDGKWFAGICWQLYGGV